MYDRYKSRKKNTAPLRVFGVILLVAAIGFLGYRYRNYFTFWKLTQGRIYRSLENAKRIASFERRRVALSNLVNSFEQLKKEKPLDAEAFFLSAEARYLLGESMLAGGFSELVVNDAVPGVGGEARNEFLRSIRDFRKGMALNPGGLTQPRAFMLAKAGFYTGFYSPAELMGILGDSPGEDTPENIRLYALLCIMNAKEDYGLKLLADKGMVNEGIGGILFRATAERLAKRYTASIGSYRRALAEARDDRLKRMIYLNLGRIYFHQSLYKESLEQFSQALALDDKDPAPRIWMGKNYKAMGDKEKARMIWSEILTNDSTNAEAKELLKSL